MSQLPSNGGAEVPRTWKTWKKRTPEFKERALKRMQEETDLVLLAKELSVSVRTVYRWKEIQLLGRVKPAREPKPLAPRPRPRSRPGPANPPDGTCAPRPPPSLPPPGPPATWRRAAPRARRSRPARSRGGGAAGGTTARAHG